jgi:hypothetical protein
MTTQLHVICHKAADGLNFRDMHAQGDNVWLSEAWSLKDEEVKALKKAGTFHRHEKKSRPSTFGGRILRIERSKTYPDSGWAVIFEARKEARGVKWPKWNNVRDSVAVVPRVK